MYNRLLNKPILVGAYNITFSLIDKGLLEVAGPTGLGKIVFSVGNRLNRFQTGRAYDYAAVMFISALALPILLQLQSHLIVSNTLLLEVTAGFPLESGDHAVIDVIGVENFDNNLARVDQFPQLVGFGYMLFLTGIAGMVFNYKNFLITMMCIEIMYLGVITSFVFYGIAFNDTTAIIYGLLVLVFAACESAVGLGLLVAVYRFGRTISFNALTTLGG